MPLYYFAMVDDDYVRRFVCDSHRSALEKYIDVKFEALDRSIELATAVLNERLEKLNYLRDMVNDRDAMFVNKTEFDLQVANIEHLRLSEAKLSGKADQSSVTMAYVLSVVGLILGCISLLFQFTR